MVRREKDGGMVLLGPGWSGWIVTLDDCATQNLSIIFSFFGISNFTLLSSKPCIDNYYMTQVGLGSRASPSEETEMDWKKR